MQTETRILTVPQGQVKGELQVRQAFGWNLAQTSARSFATGASVLGGATEIGGGTYLAGGQVLVRNAHLTDLTLQRHASPRSQRLDTAATASAPCCSLARRLSASSLACLSGTGCNAVAPRPTKQPSAGKRASCTRPGASHEH